MTDNEIEEIVKVFEDMDIKCCLKEVINNEFVTRLEFDLMSLKDYPKIKKVVGIIKTCLHIDIKQVESEKYHFAVEIRNGNVFLDMVECNEKFGNDDKCSALIGIDNSGSPVYFNLKKSIHTLIGGSTGMGKTSILNDIIYSLTRKNTPEELKIYIIDVKKTMAIWNKLPHLHKNVIESGYDAYSVLQNISEIMDSRHTQLSRRHIQKAKDNTFPRIIIIIDELADLMLSIARNRIESEITHIAQLGRDVNISLIIATQNPIVKVCTSNIKANCPTRIALKTISQKNSEVILDDTSINASKLDGVGYAIMRCAGDTTIQTFKACFLTDDEIKNYIKAIRNNIN